MSGAADTTGPKSQAAGKGLVRRVYWSTWLVMFIAAGMMALVEIPGRRTGATTFAHGWPWAYLTRDYENDQTVGLYATRNLNTFLDPSDLNLTRLDQDYFASTDDRRVGDAEEKARSDIGWPLTIEQCLDPWAWNNISGHCWLLCVPDLIVSLLIVATVAWLYQRRRRRRARAFQFRLRTLLVAVPLLSIGCARFVAWRAELRGEAELSDELASHVPQGVGQFQPPPATTKTWSPPAWLPEWAVKLGNVSQNFDRVTVVQISGDSVTDETLRQLATFGRLRNLRLFNTKVTPAGWEHLRQLPRLGMLEIEAEKVSDADLEKIATIDSLTALSIPAEKITGAGIEFLRRSRGLRFLRLEGVIDETVLERLSDLPALEGVGLTGLGIHRLHLAGMRRLRSIGITQSDAIGGAWNVETGVDSLRLESLPALESLRIRGVAAADARFDGLPALREVEFGTVRLPAKSVDQILRLPSLESLGLCKMLFIGDKRFEARSLGRLRSLILSRTNLEAVQIENLPELNQLALDENHILNDFRFSRLPKLERFRFSDNPLVNSVDLRGAPNLNSLTVSPLPLLGAVDEAEIPRPQPRRRTMPGLGELSRLEQLDLHSTLLDSMAAADIAHLSKLKTMNLDGTRLTDADLARIGPLPNLEQLDLTGTDVTDDGLEAVAQLPKLADLTLNSTSIGDAAVRRLQQRRPALGLIWDNRQPALKDFEQRVADAIPDALATLVAPARLGDRDFQSLVKLPDSQTVLNLNRTHLTDAGTASLASLTHIEALQLRETHITDAGLLRLSALHRLRALNLAMTRIGGAGLRVLESMADLKVLDLSDSDISDDSLASLRFVPHLEELSLGNTQITDAGLARLKPLAELRVLDLHGTNVTDAGLIHLQKLPRLEALRLSRCRIDGPGLDCLRALSRLTILDLSGTPSVSDGCVEHAAKLVQLKSLLLGDDEPTRSGIEDAYGALQLSDHGSRQLAVMPNLRRLSIPFFADNGIEDLETTLPNVSIDRPSSWEAKPWVEFQLFEPPRD